MLSLRHPRRLVLAASAALATLFTVPAVAGAAAPHSLGPRLQSILDSSVKGRSATFPGVALHVRLPDGTSWSGAAGKANLDSGRRMRATDRFRAGSILKPMIAAATLQLVEEGKLTLDAPLPSVLPAAVIARFPEADRITVRMLLNHTSGIAEWSTDQTDLEALANRRRIWTTNEFFDRAAALPRTGAPGERHVYSNTNYNLLGLVLEQATGKPWRAVIRERVIQRLRLTHTTLPEPGTIPRGRDIAHGYALIDGKLVDTAQMDSSMADAAGGHALLTTTEDLSRFVRALLAGRLFERKATVEQMRTFVSAQDPNGLIGYGLGLERYRVDGVELVGHVGGTGGYLTLMFHVPAKDIDIVVSINRQGDITRVLLPVLKEISRM